MGEYTIENHFSLKPNGDLWELVKGIFKIFKISMKTISIKTKESAKNS